MDGDMINSQMTDDPNANGQMAGGQDMNQMNGQMTNGGMMQNPMNGQMMQNGMMGNPMNGQMMNNGMMGNPMNGQMMNGGMMQNPMNGQMMNGGMMQNQMGGQMMNGGMMQNQMGGQMMNTAVMDNQMNGQMNGQMMSNGMMGNPMGGQMMNNGMMPNQMNGQVMAMNNSVSNVDQEPKVFDEKGLLEKMEKEMVDSAEVMQLVQSLDFNNPDAIMMFGKEAMLEMGRVADRSIEDKTRANLIDSQGQDLLVRFDKIFSQISPDELLRQKNGFLSNLKKKIDAFIAKYQKISVDLEKIYTELKKYEEDARAGNRILTQMYDVSLVTFHDLKKYIFASEKATMILNEQIEEQNRLLQETGNTEIKNNINKLEGLKELMEHQYEILHNAQLVALVNLPLLNAQQFTNYNILRKVNEYFLVGLPQLKMGISQAIQAKTQEQQTKSLAGLDAKMNELMIRNAQSITENTKNSTRLAMQSTIKAETLEAVWKTIKDGIDEVSKLQDEAHKKRIEDAKKLERIKDDFNKQLGLPGRISK